jgi:hypothetical protein
MAQWRGQFTGLTHETKVADAEDSLRTAVAALRAAEPNALPAKVKAVRRLAARLLAVRLKALKARRVLATPLIEPSTRYDLLVQEEAATRTAGVDAILVEFGAPDARE